MLSIPRLPQQHQLQHQHQQISSNSHQQHPYAQDCHSEYNPVAYSDFSRSNYDDEIAALSQQLPTDFMQPDAWGALAQQTPRFSRAAHQRESSLSSMGSSTAGPASPFTNNTSNPQIAITDAAQDQSQHNSSYYQLAKTMAPYPGYQACGGMEHAMPEMAYPITLSGPGGKPRIDRGLMHAPDFSGGSSRSHPASVASSIAGDSPATPTVGESDPSDRRRKGTGSPFDGDLSNGRSQFRLGYHNAPKLDRTMTDVYGDELYSPNFAITSTSPSQSHMAVSPTNDVFSQRLHAANNQHLSAVHSPVSTTSRDRSPFRTGSPLAPSPAHDFGNAAFAQGLPFNSAQRMREQNKVQQDVQYMHQQMSQRGEPETPKTISPKDAILEFNEPEGESNFPLFPQGPSGFEMDQFSKAMVGHSSQDPSMHDASSNGHFNFLSSQSSSGISVPQQYPFIAQPRASHETPPRLSSAGSSSNESRNSTPASRPRSTMAEGGTYTCTYHGCSQRFETPALLQKHKREGHRQTQALGTVRPRDMGMTSTLLNSQAGPHRCDRINPSTGKPCSTIFSRPYDLTRHEDTIHNARKQKVRCDLCTEEKTFSRADALTRHYRVCHPDVELPGKHRRRGA
ncbi:hypothetical protein FZEAL_10866 [Fusarium zealandicum]|uniref:C2H2-type domain-containing protein n=1 Tax=Fusarium zealandicum TaxID=1053134 RepID=A0A8H4TV10_9HYPO|nr:hypothetical protein FZEAL_10866 [Fusarium zealandicum]